MSKIYLLFGGFAVAGAGAATTAVLVSNKGQDEKILTKGETEETENGAAIRRTDQEEPVPESELKGFN